MPTVRFTHEMTELCLAIYGAMRDARDYAAWVEAARRHDALTGAGLWREQRQSNHYDHELLHSRVRLLKRLRKKDDVARLAFYLTEELHGNLGNMASKT